MISITDGQIYLQPDLFNAGVRPAADVGISVSRVGGAAQVKGMKKVAGTLRLDLAAYRELEAFAQLGTELDPATQRQLDRGARMVELLKQAQGAPMPVEEQVLMIQGAGMGMFDDLDVSDVLPFEKYAIEKLKEFNRELITELETKKILSKESAEAFKTAWKRFVTTYKEEQAEA